MTNPESVTDPNPASGEIEASYGLSPLQQGMLFHSLRDTGVGMYISQAVATLMDIDPLIYRQAWQYLLDRHSILRTSFHWEEDTEEPVQRVHRRLVVPFTEEDWTDRSASEQNALLRRLMRDERERGFNLAHPPLLRVVLIRVSRSRWYRVHSHHHILLDGWSGGLLARELGIAYDALRLGNTVPLPAARPYRNYIDWLAAQDLAKAEAFWRQQLAGFSAPTPLPWDQGSEHQTQMRAHVGSWAVSLDPQRSEALRQLAKANQVTLNALIQAAWGILLSRYSGQADVLFGLLVSGRPPSLEGVEEMIGMFLNTVPFRLTIPTDKTLREWLREIQLLQAELQSYEYSPLVRVQRWSEIRPGTPLFESILARKDVSRSGMAGAAARSSAEKERSQQSTFQQSYPLLLNVAAGSEIELKITFDERRFATPHMARLMEQMQALLDSMLADPGGKVADLSLMTAAERHRVLVEWNQPQHPAPAEALLQEMFDRRVEQSPQAPALVTAAQTWSFAGLNRAANRLAHYLRSIGVGSGSRVALSILDPVQQVIALLAGLKVGATLLPIDRQAPEGHLRQWLTEAQTRLILTEEQALARLPQAGMHFVCVDRDARAWAEVQDSQPPCAATPDSHAFWLFGPPGEGAAPVAISHRTALIRSYALPCPWEVGERLCLDLYRPTADDIWELFAAWQQGKQVVLSRPLDDEQIEPWIAELAALAPDRLVLGQDQLMRLLQLDAAVLARLGCIRFWINYGQLPDQPAMQRFVQAFSGAVLCNVVSLRETGAILVGGLPLPGADGVPRQVRPTPNTAVYILDANQQPCPVGIPGELLVSGAAMVEGYGGSAATTLAQNARRFLANPFVSAMDKPVFRTGLRLRWLADGSLEQMPGLFEGQAGEPVAGTHSPGAQAAPSGQGGFAVRRSGQRKPSNGLEATIARVWAEVLRLDEVCADDNFFDLGGHSLLATRVTARLTHLLKRDVPLKSIFSAPTVEGLAVWIENAAPEEELPYAVQIANRGKEAPLSFTQQQLWILAQLFPNIPAYTIPSNLRFSGSMDRDALQQAFRDLIERHEILRTTFVARNGEPLQIINPTPDEVPIEILDVSHLPKEERTGAARMQGAQLGRKMWDLARGPLMRVQLVRLGDEEYILNTSFHHIISDGPSNAVFCRELSKFYEGRVAGVPALLPPLPLQFADYAIWERENVRGRMFDKQAAYWKQQLDGAQLLEIPTDFTRPAVHGFKGKKVKFEVPREVVLSLREIARSQNSSIFMCLVAVFQCLLARYSGQEDVLIGTAMTNRIRVELERLIGLFVNTLPLRTHFGADPSFKELLGRVRDCCVGAFANMDLPFEETIRQIQPHRDLSRQGSPLFQFMLIHNPTGGGSRESRPGFQQGEPHNDTGFSNFDILLSTSETPDGEVRFTLVYDTELFKPETIDRMIGHFQALFRAVAAEPDLPLSQLSILSPEERKTLLQDWCCNPGPLPQRCVHELINDIADKKPDHPALVFAGASLTYRQMQRQSAHIAQALHQAGMGPERLVAVCLPRGFNLILSLLGVLNAGAAFVPMDPTFPLERIRQLLRDAGCSALICEPGLADALAGEVASILALNPAEDGKLPQRDEFPVSAVGLDHLAYVIYTSGSTGTPKGVLVEHGALANTILGQLEAFAMDAESRVLQMLSINFDAAVGEVFRALCAGATLVLAKKEALLPGPGLLELLHQQRISVVAMTPTALAALPDVSDALPALKTLIVGGEACPAAIAQKWGPGRRLINGYGPTETAIGATCAVNWPFTNKPPLGRPLPNVRLYVLDRALQPSPIGIAGELYIGGRGVARGYLGRPDLTAERFLPDPYSPQPGARCYRTGDLVRWNADGSLDFIGRVDQQVKLRGFRIELGEIEETLLRQGSLAQCAVDIVRTGAQERLVAYLASKSGETLSTAELKDYLKARLPEYMVPAHFMLLPRLPMNNSGKVDRKALPRPNFDELVEKTEYIAPTTELEKGLAAVWIEVLGIKQIGLLDNFFALGGDSISAIRVVARAAEQGIALEPQDIFKLQSLGELCQHLQAK
jgi:amino acid adenylation domain-containing protein